MSIFDQPKPILNPILWGPDKTMLPEARQYFLDLLQTKFPLSKVSAMVMVGSSLGYQYSETSDIDINVMAIEGEDFDKWHEVFKTFYDTHHYPGTKHPVNFFYQEYRANATWDNSLGAYDVLNNMWIKKTISPEHIGDPEKKYEREIAYGNLFLSMIESEVANIETAAQIGDTEGVKHKVKELAKIFHQIERNRKLSYSIQTAPALRENNIFYKLIEASKYAPLFHELVENYQHDLF